MLIVIVVIIAFDSCLFDRPVHALNLTVGPGVSDLGQAVFDIVFITDTVKDVPSCRFVFLAVGELDAIIHCSARTKDAVCLQTMKGVKIVWMR